MRLIKFFLTISSFIGLTACNTRNTLATSSNATDTSKTCCIAKAPPRYGVVSKTAATNITNDTSTIGMVWVSGGTFMMGGDNDQASADEFPKHPVTVDGFWMDATEVTNAQFEAFVKATGYITTAEKKPLWEELKKQLPPNTPQPPDSVLVPASLVFKATSSQVDLSNYSQWWQWVEGANWLHPQGPNSYILGKENYPAVHISWDDAIAYCNWSGKRLPTEAEWEYACRGGLVNQVYSWGSEALNAGKPKCNAWQGNFPYKNDLSDGYYGAAPVKSYKPNNFGLYDMAGNVWEWCSDYYRHDYYTTTRNGATNPKGPANSYDPDEVYTPKRVIRGGSFLCNDSYCSGYRAARRMKSSPDTGLEHLGFRCVRDTKIGSK